MATAFVEKDGKDGRTWNAARAALYTRAGTRCCCIAPLLHNTTATRRSPEATALPTYLPTTYENQDYRVSSVFPGLAAVNAENAQSSTPSLPLSSSVLHPAMSVRINYYRMQLLHRSIPVLDT